jgi:hypothetical protein
MTKIRKWVTKMCVVAGAMLLSSVGFSLSYDASILIDRALNSPTLTVRYSGASAALVEFRLNGVSLGTRALDASKNSGETNFQLNLKSLVDGDNEIEVRLFDKSGKLLGSEKTYIATDDHTRAPVFLEAPKVGSTVRGPLEIKVGFGRQMNSPFVNFFINNEFRSMKNHPPYSYIWDTEREANGWHEIEAWVVDENSQTFKTRKVKVFINNPGGRTNRNTTQVEQPPVNKPVELSAAANALNSKATGDAGLKSSDTKASSVSTAPKAAAPVPAGVTAANDVKGIVANPSATKSADTGAAVAAGAKHLTPTGTRTAVEEPVRVAKNDAQPGTANPVDKKIVEVASAAAVKTPPAMTPAEPRGKVLLNVEAGTRLNHSGAYAILMNSSYVNFDVSPRVQDGIPLTPFRHLIEHAGGKVDWEGATKSASALAEGREIFLRVGDKLARVDRLPIELELAPFIERGRIIVPLSFIRMSLDVDVQYDPETGHVLITNAKK